MKEMITIFASAKHEYLSGTSLKKVNLQGIFISDFP